MRITGTGHETALDPSLSGLIQGKFAWDAGLYVTAGDVTFSGNLTVGGKLLAQNELQPSSVNAVRFMFGSNAPAVILRKDTGNFYFLLTDAGDREGTFNDLCPLHINLASGRVAMSEGLNVAGGINIVTGILNVGTSQHYTDGNIKGDIWKDWHPSGWLKNAIDARITTRLNATLANP